MKNQDQEDENNFQALIEGVEKIKTNSVFIKPKQIKKIKKDNNFVPEKDISDLGFLDVGNLSFVDRNTAKKFKTSKLKIDASIDLHGLTEKEAFSVVCDFVKDSYSKRFRNILIITGNGECLKNRLPEWLNTYFRSIVLCFVHPAQNKGGQGALQILLKRH